MATFFDNRLFSVIGIDSAILVGAKLYWYASGTSSSATTYANEELTVANANPVTFDANGRAPAIWLAPGDYKYVLTPSDGSPVSPILSQDPYHVSQDAPTYTPDLTDFLSGDEPLPIANGGTGATTAVDALASLSALGLAGGELTGQITQTGHGGYWYHNSSGMSNGRVVLITTAASTPTLFPGLIIARYDA